MKTKLLYIAALGMALWACSDDFTYPPMVVPEASMKPNTTIAQLKEQYWQNDRNYVQDIHTLDDGSDMIIKGRVISSDSTGNIFKNIVIDDGTAALTIAINAYDLYESYQYGQNIVVNVSGLEIGGYNGLMQLGSEGSYNGAPSMTFMTKETFDAHAEPDGLANPALVVPTVYTIPQLAQIKSNSKELCLTQSKLVKLEGVHFVDAGKPFAPTSTVDRYVVDKDGNRLNVRCSSYSDFKNDIIPDGYGDVTGILSYYGSDWQMMLINLRGLEGFTPATPSEPTEPSEPDKPDTPGQTIGDGTEASPFSVADVQGGATGTGVWVKGYIVGWIDGKTIADGAKFSGSATVATNLMIADSPDATDVAKVIPVQLPTGDVRAALNLVDHPANYKKEVMLQGSLETYFGTHGVKSVTAYKIDNSGSSPDTPETGSIIFTSLVNNIDGWTINNALMPSELSYIWQWDAQYGCLKASGYKGGNFATDSYITTKIDLSGYKNASAIFQHTYKYGENTVKSLTLVAREQGTNDWTTLTIPQWPTGQDWNFVESGNVDLSAFAGKNIEIGFRYTSTSTAAATWEIKNFNISATK